MAVEPSGGFIFLAHAGPDRAAVEEIAQILAEQGLASWAYFHDQQMGDDYRDAILEKIERAKYVLALFSRNAVARPGVFGEECSRALDRQLRERLNAFLIPILLDDVAMPAAWTHLQYGSWNDPSDRKRILNRLRQEPERIDPRPLHRFLQFLGGLCFVMALGFGLAAGSEGSLGVVAWLVLAGVCALGGFVTVYAAWLGAKRALGGWVIPAALGCVACIVAAVDQSPEALPVGLLLLACGATLRFGRDRLLEDASAAVRRLTGKRDRLARSQTLPTPVYWAVNVAVWLAWFAAAGAAIGVTTPDSGPAPIQAPALTLLWLLPVAVGSVRVMSWAADGVGRRPSAAGWALLVLGASFSVSSFFPEANDGEPVPAAAPLVAGVWAAGGAWLLWGSRLPFGRRGRGGSSQ